MTSLRSALERYLSMRQGLGYKYLREIAIALASGESGHDQDHD